MKRVLLILLILILSIHTVNADLWRSNTSLENGLIDVGQYSAPNVYNNSTHEILISGNFDGDFDGFYWNGTAWVLDASLIAGLGNIGIQSHPTIFYNGTHYVLISGEVGGGSYGFYWDGTAWNSDSDVVNGIDAHVSTPEVYYNGTHYVLISGNGATGFVSFYWNGSSWITDSALADGLEGDRDPALTIYNDSNVYKSITTSWSFVAGGGTVGTPIGFYWDESEWGSNTTIINGVSIADRNPTATVYNTSTSFNLITGDFDGTFSGWTYNYAPTKPIFITPTDSETLIEATINLTASSTDQNEDSLNYYFFEDGNLIGNSTNGTLFWNPSFGGYHDLTVNVTDGYEWIESDSISVLVFLDPTLFTPTNGSSQSYSYPPLLHDVDLTWSNVANQYRYQVARDSEFNLILIDDYLAYNYSTASLEVGTYYWRVYSYDSVTFTQGNSSEIFNFTITETVANGTGTAINGIIYTDPNGASAPLDNAIVSIFNDTWSSQMTTGSNGYYLFDYLGNDTYSIQATKPDYSDSQVQLVTTTTNETVTRNILMELREDESQYYSPHYVEFTVKSIFDTRYENVAVSVYKEDDLNPLYTGSTGTAGSVTFKLVENIEYTLTFVNTTQGISDTWTGYPVNDAYSIYVIPTIVPDDEYSSDVIDVTVTKTLINNSHAYINVSYNDSLAQTTALSFNLNQSDISDIQNQSTIDSWTGVSQSTNISFIVEDYTGESYFLHVSVEHTEFGSVDRTYAVTFGGMAEDHGFERLWIWMGVGAIMFTGLLAKAGKAEEGAVMVCAVSWVIVIQGWFDNLGSRFSLAITMGLTLATILAIASVMAKGRKEG